MIDHQGWRTRTIRLSAARAARIVTWQRNGERRAAAFSLALCTHRTKVSGDDVAHQGEPEPEPGVTTCGRVVFLAKAIEHLRQKLLGDALAVVVNRHAHRLFGTAELDPDGAPRGRELHGICQ